MVFSSPVSLSDLVDQEDVCTLQDRILIAQGKKNATLLLKNCRLVNVYSGEIYTTDIAIYKDRIVSITAGAVKEAQEVIDCQGSFAIPGMMDPHMHVDTTMLWPNELARVLVPLGTTTLFVDTVNVAHNGGKEAIKAMMKSFEGLPLRAYFSAPSYCPLDPEMETAAAEIHATDVAEMLQWDGVVSIGETVSSKILNLEDDFLTRLALCDKLGKIVCGHSGDLPTGNIPALDAYIAAGVRDDHCVSKIEDILPRLQRGLSMFLVEAPGREQIHTFFDYIRNNRLPTEKMSLCIDNVTIMDIVGSFGGYLDRPFRLGLKAGLDPVDVVRMATLNPATHYKLDGQLGSLTPGRIADIVLLKELTCFPPEIVITNGKIVARQGKLVVDIPSAKINPEYLNSIHLPAAFASYDYAVPAGTDKPTVTVRVIQVADGAGINTGITAELKVVNGQVQPDLERDILKMSIIERYQRRGSMMTAFAHGFDLKCGALASSYSVPSNNMVVVGTNEADMTFAVQYLEKIQGGCVAVKDGQVLAVVHMRIGGMMSAEPYEELLQEFKQANAAAKTLGCPLQDPFLTLSQTTLLTLPDLGLTDRGLVDARLGKLIDVVMNEQ